MFVPDRFKLNSYRVLRISGSSNRSQIYSAATSMKRAAMLGVTGTTEDDQVQLGEVPRTEADIRTAIGRLENPAQRLSERLFWFNLPTKAESSGSGTYPSTPLDAKAEEILGKHDNALRGIFSALGATLDDPGIELWVQSLQGWHKIVSNDDYWAFSMTLEEEGGFEPAALPSEIETLRGNAVSLAAESLLAAARDALVRNDALTFKRVFVALGILANTGPWVALAQVDVASPAISKFRELCRSIRDECFSKVVRKKDTGKSNKKICDAALKRFRAEVQPAFAVLAALFPKDQEATQQAREESALCLSQIATDYTWADEFILSEKLHQEALVVARDTLGAVRIEARLEEVRGSARHQRVYGSEIASAPNLGTTNGFGFTLYGHSDYDQSTQSYTTTHYFVVFFIPVFPICRYRVINVGGNRYRFLGKLPYGTGNVWHLGIVAAIIAAFVISASVNRSPQQGPQQSSRPAYYTPQPSAPAYNPPVSYKQTQISALKSRIEANRAQLDLMATRLKPVFAEAESLKSQMEGIESVLKSLDAQNNTGVPINVNDYNTRVGTYNDLLARRKALIDANSADYAVYQNLVKQDSDLVDEYNALLK